MKEVDMLKDRIKKIRKSMPECGKTQDDFANFLGIPKPNLSSYETGRRVPSDAVIQLICEKCNVNKEWLENGTGEMKKSRTENQEIIAFANEIMDLPDENFKKRFIEALTKLDSQDWETIQKIIDTVSIKED